jgi:hypothetical protein
MTTPSAVRWAGKCDTLKVCSLCEKTFSGLGEKMKIDKSINKYTCWGRKKKMNKAVPSSWPKKGHTPFPRESMFRLIINVCTLPSPTGHYRALAGSFPSCGLLQWHFLK